MNWQYEAKSDAMKGRIVHLPRKELEMQPYAIVITTNDRSAIVGLYGPYDSAEIATHNIDRIQTLPGMAQIDGNWEVFPLFFLAFRTAPPGIPQMPRDIPGEPIPQPETPLPPLPEMLP